jgi:hypothetical protein
MATSDDGLGSPIQITQSDSPSQHLPLSSPQDANPTQFAISPEPAPSRSSTPAHTPPANDPSSPVTPTTPSVPRDSTPAPSLNPQEMTNGSRPTSRGSHRHSYMPGRSLDSSAVLPNSTSSLNVNQPQRGPPTRTPESDRNRRRRSAMDVSVVFSIIATSFMTGADCRLVSRRCAHLGPFH